MFYPEISFYLGDLKKGGFSGVISQDNLFFVIEIISGIEEEKGHKVLEYIKNSLKQKSIDNLAYFDDFIASLVKDNNLPTGFSLASGFMKNNILYLKTGGTGKIFIRRNGKLGLLIEGDATASGPIDDDDFFIFLTENFLNLVAGSQGLEQVFDHRSPAEIIEEITPSLKAKNDLGAVALFVDLHKETDEEGLSYRETEERKSLGTTLRMYWLIMHNSKKTLTMFTVFLLFLVLLWSVVLGVQRRTSADARSKIKLVKELITQKLSTAEEVAFLNMSRALILISQSKQEIAKLTKEIGGDREEITNLVKIVQETENKILKKEMKSYSEFYDLTIDDKNASGSKIYTDSETAFILDNKRGALYKIDLEKKSLSKSLFAEIKSAGLSAGYGDEEFFYVKGSGVFRIDGEGKLKKVIDADRDWGEIIDMYLYNANIYLLDLGKDEVWKYLKTEDGFGSKASYFESGQSIDFSAINSFAIDGSVYLAGDSMIVKYTSGLRDGFRIDLPDSDFSFNKVMTSKDLEKIYLWDKKRGTVYIIGKTGDYIEQVNSEILSKGSDLIIFKNKIYILNASKIYMVD
jgi:hypothetical protein